MAAICLSLPAPMKAWIDERVGAGEWSSASEYVRSLIRADQAVRAGERLEAALLEGMESSLHAADDDELRSRLSTRPRRVRPRLRR